MTYNIHCEVCGGVTGHRTALLKQKGELVEFSTFDEAQKHADKLNDQMNHPRATAFFTYTVIESDIPIKADTTASVLFPNKTHVRIL